MDPRDGLRVVATLIGGGFLVYAAVAVLRGTLYDVDEGRVTRAARPVAFWLLVFAMMVLGLTILGVGWRWPIVGAVVRIVNGGHQ
jgi:spore maturation protein SpmA